MFKVTTPTGVYDHNIIFISVHNLTFMHSEKHKVIQVAQCLILYANSLHLDHFKRKLEGI